MLTEIAVGWLRFCGVVKLDDGHAAIIRTKILS